MVGGGWGIFVTGSNIARFVSATQREAAKTNMVSTLPTPTLVWPGQAVYFVFPT